MSPEEYADYISPFDLHDPAQHMVAWEDTDVPRFSSKTIEVDILTCRRCSRRFPAFVQGDEPKCSCGCTDFAYNADTIDVTLVIDRKEGRCYVEDGEGLV